MRHSKKRKGSQQCEGFIRVKELDEKKMRVGAKCTNAHRVRIETDPKISKRNKNIKGRGTVAPALIGFILFFLEEVSRLFLRKRKAWVRNRVL